MNKLWRGISIFILGGVLGTGFGIAVGFFIFPYVFPPPAASEQLSATERTKWRRGECSCRSRTCRVTIGPRPACRGSFESAFRAELSPPP